MKPAKLFFVLASTLLFSAPGLAQDDAIQLTLKDHKWTPDRIEVKAGERFKLRITNEDASSDEFESKSMVIEKFIGPKRTITITLGPLKPGTYDFFADFHPDVGKGLIIAK